MKDLVQEITKRSQEIILAAWNLLLSQRQEILNNRRVRVLITPDQEGTMGMRDEELSNVDAQFIDTSRYQVSDVEDSFNGNILA